MNFPAYTPTVLPLITSITIAQVLDAHTTLVSLRLGQSVRRQEIEELVRKVGARHGSWVKDEEAAYQEVRKFFLGETKVPTLFEVLKQANNMNEVRAINCASSRDVESLVHGFKVMDHHPGENSAYNALRHMIPSPNGTPAIANSKTPVGVFNRNLEKVHFTTLDHIRKMEERLASQIDRSVKELGIQKSVDEMAARLDELKQRPKKRKATELDELREGESQLRRSLRARRS